MDLFGFKKLFDTMQAQFAAVSTLLVAAPRRFDVARLHRIYPHDARAQVLDHAQALEDIARPYGGSQAIRRIVCNLKRVVFILERDARDHWPEDLLARNAGFIIGLENGGLNGITVLQLLR